MLLEDFHLLCNLAAALLCDVNANGRFCVAGFIVRTAALDASHPRVLENFSDGDPLLRVGMEHS